MKEEFIGSIQARILENQVEIIWTLRFLLECAKPELVGRAGALDRMRDDLLVAAKATRSMLERGE